jgi:hypothetical protein
MNSDEVEGEYTKQGSGGVSTVADTLGGFTLPRVGNVSCFVITIAPVVPSKISAVT